MQKVYFYAWISSNLEVGHLVGEVDERDFILPPHLTLVCYEIYTDWLQGTILM